MNDVHDPKPHTADDASRVHGELDLILDEERRSAGWRNESTVDFALLHGCTMSLSGMIDDELGRCLPPPSRPSCAFFSTTPRASRPHHRRPTVPNEMSVSLVI